MSGQTTRRFGLRLITLPIAAMSVIGFASGEKRDPIIQDRVYDHVERMDAAYAYGNTAEAIACAEMILLKRDISVYVDDRNVPSRQKGDAARAIQDAATNWEDSLGREIRIRFVPRVAADVIVKYVGEMKYDGQEAAGTVRWSRGVMNLGSGQYQYKVTASISLRTHTPSGRQMNYGQMLHTAGHELGHVMGLEDTSKYGDLMGPLRLRTPVERATRHEIQSLTDVRQRAVLVLNRIAGTDTFTEVHTESSFAQVLSSPTQLVATTFVNFSVVADTSIDTFVRPTKIIEPQTNTLRITANKRVDTPVRRSSRNRKTSKRKKKFAIGGMGR